MEPAVLDEIQRIFRAARFISDLGIELESVGDGECVTTLDVKDRHLQQDGMEQIEGVTVSGDGTLYIASEAQGGRRARLFTVPWRGDAPSQPRMDSAPSDRRGGESP